jgi:hypothetical protein
LVARLRPWFERGWTSAVRIERGSFCGNVEVFLLHVETLLTNQSP